jgi:ferredoxin, 2Fe-2S
MGRVTYVEYNGTEHAIDVEDGVSVMEGAVRNGVPGIDADCGGMCACATCHVHVAPEWLSLTGEAGQQETELLDLAPERDGYSRLSCQIAMSPELDGLVVRLPESQH